MDLKSDIHHVLWPATDSKQVLWHSSLQHPGAQICFVLIQLLLEVFEEVHEYETTSRSLLGGPEDTRKIARRYPEDTP